MVVDFKVWSSVDPGWPNLTPGTVKARRFPAAVRQMWEKGNGHHSRLGRWAWGPQLKKKSQQPKKLGTDLSPQLEEVRVLFLKH